MSEKTPPIQRRKVQQKNSYREYREELRSDFHYSCAYCTLTEQEAQGVGFEIDHYMPSSQFPEKKNDYENLLWCCVPCNRNKDAYYPNEQQEQNGYFVLRPDRHIPSEHLYLENDTLHWHTSTGEFHITLLSLNRSSLRKLRKLRQQFWEYGEYIAFGMYGLSKIPFDQLPPKWRGSFLKQREQIMQKCQRHQELLTQLLASQEAKSPLLDPDPNKKDQQKMRRKYLQQIQAISPELPSISKKKK